MLIYTPTKFTIVEPKDNLEDLLWRVVIQYQKEPFYTVSGLAFSYTVKRRKNGAYSGELLISRKEESKTLTRSSVMLAFQIILEHMDFEEIQNENGTSLKILHPPKYRGPKAIGQIFGVSYVYSLFWRFGVITIPKRVEEKMLRMIEGSGKEK